MRRTVHTLDSPASGTQQAPGRRAHALEGTAAPAADAPAPCEASAQSGEEPHGRACKSCGQPFAGRYCPNCGEKVVLPEDHALLRLAGGLSSQTCRKLSRSLWLLLWKPGFLAKEYIEGRRRPYVHAKTLFLTANIIYLVYMPFDGLNVSLQTQMDEELYSPLVRRMIARRVDAVGMTVEEFADMYDPHVRTMSKLLLVELVPIFTLLFALQFRDRAALFFDHFVFALYFVTVTMWLDWLIVPSAAAAGLQLAAWAGWTGFEDVVRVAVTAWIPVLITLIYVYYGANRYYGGPRPSNLLRALVAAGLYHVLVNLYRFSLLIVALYTV